MRAVKAIRVLFFGMLVLGLATSAIAQAPVLNNSEAPGSVLVFPKFIKGTITLDGVTTPKTEIEISITCPQGYDCAELTRVKLRGHWVCPGEQTTLAKFTCRETDFNVFATINETVVISPTGRLPGSKKVPKPACNEGFLVVWVINLNDDAINFNGLIGNAVLRNDNGSASAYNAVPIQAVNDVGGNPPLTSNTVNGPLVSAGGPLSFDGQPGNYKAIAGKVYGTVRYERPATVPPTVGEIQTYLTILTLDVISNRPNYPVFVDFDFYNQAEELTSTFWEFVCWTQVRLTTIDENLNEIDQGTGSAINRKGMFESFNAEKVPFIGIDDSDGPVTLLAIVETREFNGAGGLSREYAYSAYHDLTAVATTFYP